MCKTSSCAHPMMKAVGLLALRAAIAIIFISMGYNKLGPNHAGTVAMFSGLQFPGPAFWAYFIGLLELIGGLMVLLGVFAKYAATWLAVIMVVAMLTTHRGGPLMGYFLPLAVLGGCLALMGVGAGRWRLVRPQCHCPHCKNMMMDKGGCCGGRCGGGSCGSEMMDDKCSCQKCCGGQCHCGGMNECSCCGNKMMGNKMGGMDMKKM